MYEYAARLIKVVDGDTLDLEVDLGFDIHFNMRVRLQGLDTPELNSKDPLERLAALEAKHFVERALEKATLRILTHKDSQDKYGRYLATVTAVPVDTGLVATTTVNQALLDAGLAKPYDGGKR